MKNRNTQLIEIVVNGVAGGNQQRRIQINDQPYLRNAFTWSLETYNSTDITTSPQGNALVTAAQLKSSFLTLYLNDISGVKGTGEYVQLLPLSNLHTLQNGTPDPFERESFEMMGQTISWDKCYITLGAALANTSNVSFLFNIGFTFSKDQTTS